MAERTLVDADARRRAAGELDRTVFVEAGAGSGKTTILVERVAALVASGVPITAIAAITFTERAGAELRSRLRRRFAELARNDGERRHEAGLIDADALANDVSWADALAELDGASIGTIHSFAQQVLASHPLAAGLPPRFDVLDESASAVAFERRWRAVAAALYEPGDDDDGAIVRRAVELALALEVTPRNVRQLTRALDEAWDLTIARLAQPVPLPVALLDGPLRSLRSDLRAVGALADCCLDPTEDRLAQHLRTIAALADELDVASSEPAVVAVLRNTKFTIGNKGLQNNWVRVPGGKPEIGAQLSRLDGQVKAALAETSEAVLTVLAHSVGRLVGAHAVARRTSGRLEFHDLLVLARDLLRDRRRGTAVRRSLHERFRAVLIDEFQDTDPLQFELASLITAAPYDPRLDSGGSDDHGSDDHGSDDHAGDDQGGDSRLPEPVAGRLFLVGDPKQSIYRFRRADLGLYLRTRDRLAGTPLALQTNFRATKPIVAWLNAMFEHLIVAKENSQAGYVRLSSGRPDAPSGPAVTVLGGPHLDGKIPADELRRREAFDVASVITNAIAQAWQTAESAADGAAATRPLRYADIAILLPTRTSLPAIEQALGRAGIPTRIEASTLLWAAPEVAELVAVAAAAARPDDELGVVTALRTTLLGASDADLYRHRVVRRGSFAPGPTDGSDDDGDDRAGAGDPVAAGLAALHRWSLLARWAAPSTLLTTIADEARAFEVAALAHRPREPMRRLRLALEQTRAFTDSTGATVDEWLNWIERQRVEGTRVGEPLLPEDDDDAVRLLTIHAAKGLEFPMVVVAGLTTQPGGPPTAVNVIWPPDGGTPAIRLSKSMSSASFDDAKDLDNQLDDDERVRLLYVACTRARDHLAVSLHHLPDGPRTLAFLLAEATDAVGARASPLAEPALALRPAAAGLRPTTPPPWQAMPPSPSSSISATALAAALAPHTEAGHRPSTIAANGGVDTDTDTEADVDADVSAALIRRAAATALGQAVHRTLEHADANDMDAVTRLATHAAAEQGLPAPDGELVAHLARVALGTPIMGVVAAGAPHWRELYVALPVAGRVLEGYIDLLVRTPDGLVVVDYKTDADPPPPGGPSPAHRIQLAAYAHVLAEVTGQQVAGALAIYCRDETSPERAVTDLAAAIDEVRSALAAGTGT